MNRFLRCFLGVSLFLPLALLCKNALCAKCPQGYYWNSTSYECVICPINKYCPGGEDTDHNCPDYEPGISGQTDSKGATSAEECWVERNSKNSSEFDHGVAKMKCYFKEDYDNPCEISVIGCYDICDEVINVISCDEGYCQVNQNPPLACPLAPLGYYHDRDDDKDCEPCRFGLTTATPGAVNELNCVIARGEDGTQFCDADGNCFTLPEGNSIMAISQ